MWHSMRMPQVVSEAVDKPRNIQFKGTTDLVTDTDQASEDAVLAVRTRPPSTHCRHWRSCMLACRTYMCWGVHVKNPGCATQ